MINLKTKTFKAELEKAIDDFKDKVVGVYQVGSSLYLENFGDIDLIALTTEPIYVRKRFEYKGHRVNLQARPKSVMESLGNVFIAEIKDIKCIYGEDTIERIDILEHEEMVEPLLKRYEEIIVREPKRKWNYLLLKFKAENKSHKLSEEQIAKLQKAHDGVEE